MAGTETGAAGDEEGVRFWTFRFRRFFFKQLLMSPSLHGMITPLHFHCLLSEKSLLSLPLALACYFFLLWQRGHRDFSL